MALGQLHDKIFHIVATTRPFSARVEKKRIRFHQTAINDELGAGDAARFVRGEYATVRMAILQSLLLTARLRLAPPETSYPREPDGCRAIEGNIASWRRESRR